MSTADCQWWSLRGIQSGLSSMRLSRSGLRSGVCLWTASGAAARWCARWWGAARGCGGRRRTPQCPARSVSAQRAISRPWSLVRVRTRRAGWRANAAVTAAATWGALQPCGSGTTRVWRLTRSTSVAAALRLAAPTIRSPSQWPGSLRSPAAAGRWLSGRVSPSALARSSRAAARPLAGQQLPRLGTQRAAAVGGAVDRLRAPPRALGRQISAVRMRRPAPLQATAHPPC